MSSRWFHNVLFASLLVAAIVLTYSPALRGSFLWDDDVHLTANPNIVGPQGLKDVWTTGAAVYYPLTLTSFWLQHLLWGLNPFPYHLVNICMHGAAAIALWQVLLLLKVRGAWFCAALWALHPVQVESVAWITELKNTQSAVLYLLAVWFFLRWLASQASTDRHKHAGTYYVVALLFGLLAILSKTSTVMLPVVLGLVWWWKDSRWRWRNVLWLMPFLLISLSAGVWTIWEQRNHSGALGLEWANSGPERAVIAGRAVWFYLGKLFWPDPLIFIYPRWTIDATQPVAYLPALAVAIAFFVLWRHRAGQLRPVFFAFCYFLASLFPVSGFFNIYFFRYSFVADHFQYLAAMGPLALMIAVIGVALSSDVRRRQILAPAFFMVLLVVCATLSWRQSKVYANSEILWTDTLAKNPNAWMAHTNLGAELDDQGRFSDAVVQYRLALRINPNDAGARNNLANHLARLGRLPEAVAEWQGALQIQPRNAEAHANLAFTLAQLEKVPEAFDHWEQALKIKPDLADAHYDFGMALARAGRLDEAIEHFREALQFKPFFAEAHYRLALALKQQSKFEDAIAHHRQALRIDPDLIVAQNALAWVLATCPVASLRNGNEAVDLARQANQISGNKYPQVLDTLAAAYAESGKFGSAAETAKRALTLLASQNNKPLTDDIQSRLKLYEARTPYHESNVTPE